MWAGMDGVKGIMWVEGTAQVEVGGIFGERGKYPWDWHEGK